MNNALLSSLDFAEVLLTPKNELNPLLFGADNKMLSDVRDDILLQTDFLLKKTSICDFIIKDISLVGSNADYFYHENSNIDILIEVETEADYFSADEINTMLAQIKSVLLNGYQFQYKEKRVDFILSAPNDINMPKYSISQNKWVVEPDKNRTHDLDVNEIREECKNRYYEIESFMAYNDVGNLFQTAKGLEDLLNYRKEIFKKSKTSIKECIIFRLLKYTGIINKIDNVYTHKRNDFLSIE